MALRCSAPACNSSAAAPWLATSSRWLSATVPPSSSPWHSRPAALPRRPGLPSALPRRPGQQHLPDGSSLQRPCRQSSVPTVPCLQQLRRSAPASNKPHPAEKSTPVWLAIWRTWAGFANSQLLPDAATAAPSRALSAESLAERQLFRTDFRFASSLPQRFACGPFPFTRTWASTVCAEELPTPREMPVH